MVLCVSRPSSDSLSFKEGMFLHKALWEADVRNNASCIGRVVKVADQSLIGAIPQPGYEGGALKNRI